MKAKGLFLNVLLFILCVNFISCQNEDELNDKIENVKIYISPQTDTYQPWGANEPVECLLIKEEHDTEYTKVGLSGIIGFEYEKGYEYLLLVEKTTFANPPADSGNTSYKLIEMLSKELADKQHEKNNN